MKNLVSLFAVLLLMPAALCLMELSCSSSFLLMVSSSLAFLACLQRDGGQKRREWGGGGRGRYMEETPKREGASSGA